MKRIAILIAVCTVVLGLTLQTGIAAEEFAGKPIHDKDCLGCHGTEMYQRDPLFVTYYRQLEAQVNACATRNNIVWSEDETDMVIDYLCDAFYGFE